MNDLDTEVWYDRILTVGLFHLNVKIMNPICQSEVNGTLVDSLA